MHHPKWQSEYWILNFHIYFGGNEMMNKKNMRCIHIKNKITARHCRKKSDFELLHFIKMFMQLLVIFTYMIERQRLKTFGTYSLKKNSIKMPFATVVIRWKTVHISICFKRNSRRSDICIVTVRVTMYWAIDKFLSHQKCSGK